MTHRTLCYRIGKLFVLRDLHGHLSLVWEGRLNGIFFDPVAYAVPFFLLFL